MMAFLNYKETQVMVNELENYFHTRFLFKVDLLPQNLILLLDIATTIFNNLITDVREFLISEGIKVGQTLL